MPGRRIPQRCVFDTTDLPYQVAADSFYGCMGAVSDLPFPDDDPAAMNFADNGRPSPPPSLVKGMLLLWSYEDVSDGGTVKRAKYNLRKEVGLDLSLDFPGYHPTSLTKHRSGLYEVMHCQAAP